jgi:hypothetical protein
MQDLAEHTRNRRAAWQRAHAAERPRGNIQRLQGLTVAPLLKSGFLATNLVAFFTISARTTARPAARIDPLAPKDRLSKLQTIWYPLS